MRKYKNILNFVALVLIFSSPILVQSYYKKVISGKFDIPAFDYKEWSFNTYEDDVLVDITMEVKNNENVSLFIFDKINLEKWKSGNKPDRWFCYAAYETYEAGYYVMGEKGTYYVILDNSYSSKDKIVNLDVSVPSKNNLLIILPSVFGGLILLSIPVYLIFRSSKLNEKVKRNKS